MASRSVAIARASGPTAPAKAAATGRGLTAGGRLHSLSRRQRLSGHNTTSRTAASRVRARDGDDTSTSAEPKAAPEELEEMPGVPSSKGALGKGVNLFDPAATASRFLTRRFGIVGGLGFVAFLASTEGYEIVKALFEKDTEGSGEEVETPSGLRYADIKVGGGVFPKAGDFVGLNVSLTLEDGTTVLDTKATGRPVAFTFGKKVSGVVCKGVEEAVGTMKRGGVRDVTVPSELGFGQQGLELPSGASIPPGATLKYRITLEEVTGSYL